MSLRHLAMSIAAAAALVCAIAVEAGEMIVHGRVVDVEPLTTSASPDSRRDCQPPRPEAGAGLAALLAWDLRVDCPPAAPVPRVTGYRVYYQWDGRTYSRVMAERPGATIPLRVRTY